MKLCKCANGHFYDGDIYQNCPHCKGTTEETAKETPVVYPQKPKEEEESNSKNPTISMFSVKNFTKQEEERKGHHQNVHSSTVVERNSLEMEIEKLNRTVSFPSMSNTDMERSYKDDSSSVSVLHGVAESRNDRQEVQKKRITEPADEGKTVSFSSRQEDAKEPLVGWLVGLNGDVYGEGFPLYAGRNFIGRDISMDVMLRGDNSVSRDRHAIVIYDPVGRQFLIQPGESKALFYMNGELVIDTKTMLDGCILMIGKTKLKFVAFCGADFSWDTLE